MATIKGVWRFDETLTGITPAVFEGLRTTSLDDIKISFTAYSPSFMYNRSVVGLYYATENDIDGFCYQTEERYGDSGYWFYGNTADAWYNNFPVWDFGDTAQTVSDDFYAWLTANAVSLDGEEDNETPTAATITYNGSTIATLNGGQSATLKCKGMKMESDVVVEVAEMPEVEVVEEYDGTITIV